MNTTSGRFSSAIRSAAIGIGFTCIVILILSSDPHTSNSQEALDKDKFTRRNVSFSDPNNLAIERDDHIHIAIIAKGLSEYSLSGHMMKVKFRSFIRSLILHAYEMPIHIIVLTDNQYSINEMETIFMEEHPPFKLFNYIGHEEIKKVPRFAMEFIELEKVLDRVRIWDVAMKAFFNNPGAKNLLKYEKDGKTQEMEIVYADKYNHDLFYVRPFYHRIFPNISKLLAFDIDLEFRIDLFDLYALFDKFSESQLIGVANDLAPHYHQMLDGYRKNHPETLLGRPGPYQGLNVGVLMLDLDKIRDSETYAEYLKEDVITRIAMKYHMTMTHLGEQDWMTLVQYENPDLFYILSCLYNRQTTLGYNQEPWTEIFNDYHYCPGEKEHGPYIQHNN